MSKKYLQAQSSTGVSNKKVISKFAMKIMTKLGWQEYLLSFNLRGEGLGKNKSGQVEIIQVKKREENVGLGKKENTVDWTNKWWENSYDNILQKVKVNIKESENEDSSEDEDSTIEGSVTKEVIIQNTIEDKSEQFLHKKRKRQLKMIKL